MRNSTGPLCVFLTDLTVGPAMFPYRKRRTGAMGCITVREEDLGGGIQSRVGMDR